MLYGFLEAMLARMLPRKASQHLLQVAAGDASFHHVHVACLHLVAAAVLLEAQVQRVEDVLELLHQRRCILVVLLGAPSKSNNTNRMEALS